MHTWRWGILGRRASTVHSTAPVQQGDWIFFDQRTVHYGPENRNSEERVCLFIMIKPKNGQRAEATRDDQSMQGAHERAVPLTVLSLPVVLCSLLVCESALLVPISNSRSGHWCGSCTVTRLRRCAAVSTP